MKELEGKGKERKRKGREGKKINRVSNGRDVTCDKSRN